MCALAASISGYYRCYSDDILWVCAKEFGDLVQDETEKALKNLGERIKVNKAKNVVSEYSEGPAGSITCASKRLQYLGFEFDGKATFIRSSTLLRYWRRVVWGVRSAKKKTQISASAGGSPIVYKRSLYRRFTHLSRANFIRYALNCAGQMDGDGIKRQVDRHWERIQGELSKPLER